MASGAWRPPWHDPAGTLVQPEARVALSSSVEP